MACRSVALGTLTPVGCTRFQGCSDTPGPHGASRLAPLEAQSHQHLVGRPSATPGGEPPYPGFGQCTSVSKQGSRKKRHQGLPRRHDLGTHGGEEERGPTQEAKRTLVPRHCRPCESSVLLDTLKWISMFIKPWIIEKPSGTVFHLYDSMNRELRSTFALLLKVYKDGGNQRHQIHKDSRPSCNK